MTLSFDQFKTRITHEILNFLPEDFQSAEVKISTMQKLGDSYTALTLPRKNIDASPAINLERYYDKYLFGREIEELLTEMADVFQTAKMDMSLDWIKDYAKVKDKLFIRVSNAERNMELLEHVPHKRVEDLAITCHVFLENTNESLCSTIVNNDLLNAFGISKTQLFQDAVENGEKLMPITIQTMTELMEKSGISQSDEFLVKSKIPMYIISNSLSLNGAASMFYPGVMDEISERCNGDFYLIPSSIHEVLAVPATSDIDVEKLEQTIEFVNETQVYGPDQLGNHLYRYDSKESVLEMVQTPSVIAETLSSPAFFM